jgi:hypothetical protein
MVDNSGDLYIAGESNDQVVYVVMVTDREIAVVATTQLNLPWGLFFYEEMANSLVITNDGT